MSETIELILPALAIPARETRTAAGTLRIPGAALPEKRVLVDATLAAALITRAREAAATAHAPHSNFHVGAAVVMADDPDATIFSAANIENSSYGVTVCGERNALFAAASKGFRRIKYLALSTVDALGAPLSERSPCGACRQAIREFTEHDGTVDEALILIDTGEPDVLCDVLDIPRLLPHGFTFAG